MLYWVAVMVAVGGYAAEQDAQLQYLVSPPPLDWYDNGPSFWERFRGAFDRSADETFSDRLHPLNILNWTFEAAANPVVRPGERASGAAWGTLSQSTVCAFREAAVNQSLLSWFMEHQGFLTDFLWSSIDDVDERAVAPLNPSYRLAERAWWNQLSEHRQMSCGIRPLQADPYAYFSLSINDGEHSLLLCDVRYHYRGFANHQFELALSVPLPNGFAVDLGTSYQFGQAEETRRLVLKLFKGFSAGGLVHVGLALQQRPALLAGISFPL